MSNLFDILKSDIDQSTPEIESKNPRTDRNNVNHDGGRHKYMDSDSLKERNKKHEKSAPPTTWNTAFSSLEDDDIERLAGIHKHKNKSGTKREYSESDSESEITASNPDLPELDGLKTFTIPKRKKAKTDLLETISSDSREFNKEILPIIQSSLKDPSTAHYFTYSSIVLVHNDDKIHEFQERKREYKQNGYSDKDIADSYAFLLAETETEMRQLCEKGVQIGNTKLSCLGRPDLGVQLCKHPDVLKLDGMPSSYNGFLVIFKIMKGKVKSMVENHGSVSLEPTPNADAHTSKTANYDPTGTSPESAYKSTQIYLYEYDEDIELVEYPRQICPFAALNFTYNGPNKAAKKIISRITSSQRSPGAASSACAVSPSTGASVDLSKPMNSPTLPSVISTFSPARNVQKSSNRPGLSPLYIPKSNIRDPRCQKLAACPATSPVHMSQRPGISPARPQAAQSTPQGCAVPKQQASPGSATTHSPARPAQHKARTGINTEGGGCVVWEGLLVSHDTYICHAEMISYQHTIKAARIGTSLNVLCRMSLPVIQERFMEGIQTLETHTESEFDGKYYSYCELRGQRSGQGKLTNISNHLKKYESGMCVELEDGVNVLVLPSCELLKSLGLSVKESSSLLHCIVISPVSRCNKLRGAVAKKCKYEEGFLQNSPISRKDFPPKCLLRRKYLMKSFEEQNRLQQQLNALPQNISCQSKPPLSGSMQHTAASSTQQPSPTQFQQLKSPIINVCKNSSNSVQFSTLRHSSAPLSHTSPQCSPVLPIYGSVAGSSADSAQSNWPMSEQSSHHSTLSKQSPCVSANQTVSQHKSTDSMHQSDPRLAHCASSVLPRVNASHSQMDPRLQHNQQQSPHSDMSSSPTMSPHLTHKGSRFESGVLLPPHRNQDNSSVVSNQTKDIETMHNLTSKTVPSSKTDPLIDNISKCNQELETVAKINRLQELLEEKSGNDNMPVSPEYSISPLSYNLSSSGSESSDSDSSDNDEPAGENMADDQVDVIIGRPKTLSSQKDDTNPQKDVTKTQKVVTKDLNRASPRIIPVERMSDAVTETPSGASNSAADSNKEHISEAGSMRDFLNTGLDLDDPSTSDDDTQSLPKARRTGPALDPTMKTTKSTSSSYRADHDPHKQVSTDKTHSDDPLSEKILRCIRELETLEKVNKIQERLFGESGIQSSRRASKHKD